MIEVGYVAGTQAAYLRELDRFEAKQDRKTSETATVRGARRYQSRLKESGVSATRCTHASAALRFFFEEVRGLAWKPISALPEPILPLLEDYWRSHRNREWLFPLVGRGGRLARISDRHVPLSTIQQAFRKTYLASGITKKVSVHSPHSAARAALGLPQNPTLRAAP